MIVKSSMFAPYLSRSGSAIALLLGIMIAMLVTGQAAALESGQGSVSGVRFGDGVNITDNAAGAQSVTTADLDSDGDLDAISASRNDGEIRWYRNPGGLSPSMAPILIDRLAGAYTVVAADLNRDAAVDLLAAGVGTSSEPAMLVWYRNDGGPNPGFSRVLIAEGLGFPAAVHAADLDGDGDLDALLAARTGNQLWWYENQGGPVPAFTPHLISAGLNGAISVKAGDLDQDGDQDVVVAAENSDTIAWFENNGGRPSGFAPHIIRTATQAPSSPDLDFTRTVDLADINGDSRLDVVYGSDAVGEVGWYENLGGNSQFQHHLAKSGMTAVKSVIAADVDRDGDVDIVAAGGDDLFLLENNNASTPAFAVQSLAPLARGVRAVDAADLNGDGLVDLLSASQSDNRVVWYPNQMLHRSAFFSSQTRSVLDVRRNSRMAHSGDLDNDGDIDVVSISSNELIWHQNDGQAPPSFVNHLIESGIDGGRWVHVTDLDGDGDGDIVSAVPGDNRIAWHENVGGTPPQFVLRLISNNARGARAALAADLNGDGDLDVYSASHGDNKIAWYENNGAQTTSFSEHVVTLNAAYARSVFAADLDGDGNLDLMSASQQDDKVNWYRNNGGEQPSFTQYTIGLADGAQHIEAADMDGDGDIDILTASEFDNMVAWYENSGESLPQFVRRPVDGAANAVHAVHADDFDLDGDVDLVAAIEGLNAIKWYENDGRRPPQFKSHLVYDKALTAHGIHADDIDLDGDIDIVGISRDDGVVAWFENRGGNYAIEVIPSSAAAQSGQASALAQIQVTHRGRPGDAGVQLNSLELIFVDSSNVQIDAATFNRSVEAVYIYRDTSDGVFDPKQDQLIVWLEPAALNGEGRLIVPMPTGSNAIQIGVGQSQLFFLAVKPIGACATLPTPFEPAMLLSPRIASDSKHSMPLLAESVPSLDVDVSAIEADAPKYLFINEIMADNVSVLADPEEPGEYPDWFEIYNAAPFEIDLGGMHLTDDLSEPTKYRIPDGVTVSPRNYVLFIADAEDTQGPRHTNFRLSSQGESIGIFDTEEQGMQLVDVVTFDQQLADVSSGWYPSSRDEWTALGAATPGTLNMHVHVEARTFFPFTPFNIMSSSVCN